VRGISYLTRERHRAGVDFGGKPQASANFLADLWGIWTPTKPVSDGSIAHTKAVGDLFDAEDKAIHQVPSF
jgi:hypothetical protein